MTTFSRKTGDYVNKSDPLGMSSDTLLIPIPGLRILDDNAPFHIAAQGHWNDATHHDWRAIVDGSPEPLACPWVLARLADKNLDPRSVWQLSRSRREDIANDLIRDARREEAKKRLRLGQALSFPAGTPVSDITSVIDVSGKKLADVLLTGKDKDLCEISDDGTRITVAAIKHLIMESFNLTPEQFALLDDKQQIRVRHKIRRAAQRLIADQADRDERHSTLRHERTALHVSLRQWAVGPLRMERPQGSSLHHLLDYDSGGTEEDSEFRDMMSSESTQVIVVENDWASAVPPQIIGEEWPLPFEKCCWEFRISGVRVLAFTHAAPIDDPIMFCVYGRDRQWVLDDFTYRIGQGQMKALKNKSLSGTHFEFPRVARLVMQGIRASCIMMDAGICEREHVPVSRGLVKKRSLEKRPPLRDHYVVSLLRRQQRAHAAHSAGAGTGGGRRQRGHWRPGRYMHFDRQDAGQIQYVNDGGFWVSKTWQRWHFAGDPNNIIHKEYRL